MTGRSTTFDNYSFILRLEVPAWCRLPSPKNRSKGKWQRLKPLIETCVSVLLEAGGESTRECSEAVIDVWSGWIVLLKPS
jgi:hypothetical protein